MKYSVVHEQKLGKSASSATACNMTPLYNNDCYLQRCSV